MIKLNKIENWIDTKLVIKDFTRKELIKILDKLRSFDIKNNWGYFTGNHYIYVRKTYLTGGDSYNIFYKHSFKHLSKKDIFINIKDKLK